ncbi:MAG TPA: hypothetical protein VHY37_00350 [Tepidisphaeraceae bacterium]|jgi:hypothetical protein|nr:hypothetical protein [Tepidisphaeraceae bacterium]
MAESNPPEHLPQDESGHPDEPVHSEPTEPEMENDGEAPMHPDDRTGFSFEQRRFLWTLAGINVVAVLLGAAIIVGYLATARSQDAAVVRLEDAAKTADNNYRRTEDTNMRAMIRAAMNGDKDAVTELRQAVFDAYKDDLDKSVAYRRAQGLSADEPSNEQLENYMKNFDSVFAQNLAMNRAATTRAGAATRPETETTSQPSATPAGKEK